MDDKTIQILEETFREFSGGGQESAALFYERLFALDPSLRRLFTHVEMRTQHTKLMAALGLVIASLRDLSKVVPVLEGLAVRHVRYGVEESHYQTVCAALIQTLAISFGDRFTPPVRAAWVLAYGIVSGVMIAATRQAGAGMQAAE
ncbi:hemin receptor [Rhizobium sp. KVB221]|uniref:Hemin receptor n=1 Tax=Rhizobium setariae TaxID=2801340 RepID=A0A936YQL0_9HYPH|nr:globin family protein [Rhizobium setariae]MBL0371011.1 hemin receptor [Rhizobium setariae]